MFILAKTFIPSFSLTECLRVLLHAKGQETRRYTLAGLSGHPSFSVLLTYFAYTGVVRHQE